MTEVQKPVDCRPVYVEQIDPVTCGYRLHGQNLATLRRAELLRFARDQRVSLVGETKIDIYCAIGVHLQRIGWPAERDLKKLKAKQ